jgi:choline dehydrogenase-like flavoprotein
MFGAISPIARSDAAPPRVVIVGAGFGGLWAAKTLANAPVEVVVIDRENYHLFQPLLYQVATAGLSPADIAAPIRGIVGAYRNVTVMRTCCLGTAQCSPIPRPRLKRLLTSTDESPRPFGHSTGKPRNVGQFAMA